MKTRWLVLASSALTRIYEVHCEHASHFIKQVVLLTHSNSKKKKQDLLSDRQGRYQIRGLPRSAYSERSDPTDIEKDTFAKKIVTFLEKNRKERKYQSLIIVAAPHFYGLLMKHFSEPLRRLVEKVIEKEILIENKQELKEYIDTVLRK